MASSIGTSWIPGFGGKKKATPKPAPETPDDAPPPVEPSGGDSRPYLPQIPRPAQPYMPQIMRPGMPLGGGGYVPWADPAKMQGPVVPGGGGGGTGAVTDIYGNPLSTAGLPVQGTYGDTWNEQGGTWVGPGGYGWEPWAQPGGGGAGGAGGVPGTEGGWGTFGTRDAWEQAFYAEHGRPPNDTDVGDYWDSQQFLGDYGRPPTLKEWKNRYYTGYWFSGGRGWGGGGGGGGGGGAQEEAPAPQYGWDPGLHWWNYGA